VHGLALAHRFLRLPPALLARFPGDRHDQGPAITIDVQRIEDLHHVGLVDDVAVLQAGDIRTGPADLLAELSGGQSCRGPHRPHLGPEPEAAYIGANHPCLPDSGSLRTVRNLARSDY